MWADGRKHQNTSKKLDDTSPTVSTESVLITTTIDAYENHDINFYVPGDFLTADMDKEVILLLEGELYEIMESILPST